MANENSIDSPKEYTTTLSGELAESRLRNPVLYAVIDLESKFGEMACVFEAFDQVAGDNSPAWLAVTWNEFRRLETALGEVSALARLHRVKIGTEAFAGAAK